MKMVVKENPSLQFTASEKEKAVCKESLCKLPYEKELEASILKICFNANEEF